MSDIILIPLVAFLGFLAGARWMWVVVDRAIDEYEQEEPR